VIPAIGSIREVWLESAGGAVSPIWLIGAGLVFALGAGAAISYFAWRDARRHTPLERAYRRTARRLGLARAERDAVHSAGERAGVAPVAMLVSRQAFDTVAAQPRGARSERERVALERARTRLFDAESR